MDARTKGIVRVVGYTSAAVVIAFVGPAIGRGARRSTRWVADTARETSSPALGLLADFLGPAEVHHHGQRSDVADDLLRALIGASARRG